MDGKFSRPTLFRPRAMAAPFTADREMYAPNATRRSSDRWCTAYQQRCGRAYHGRRVGDLRPQFQSRRGSDRLYAFQRCDGPRDQPIVLRPPRRERGAVAATDAQRCRPRASALTNHESGDLLGYDELETGDVKPARGKFYVHRDSNETRQVRPIVNSVETKISVDRAAFLECYSRIMMRFNKLTPHQREKLKELRAATVAVLLSPAGGGKTFLAIQRVLEELRGDAGAVVLFAARNIALALFVCKWLVVASRKSAKHVVDRVHVLVAPFEDGPRRAASKGAARAGRRRRRGREVCASGRRRGAPPRERRRAACAARRY